jgi:hypothetical protein
MAGSSVRRRLSLALCMVCEDALAQFRIGGRPVRLLLSLILEDFAHPVGVKLNGLNFILGSDTD